MPLNIAKHDAWEQILSVAKNAELEDTPVLAARYLEHGGHQAIVTRIGIVPTVPVEISSSVTVEPAPAAAPHVDEEQAHADAE